LGDSVTMPWTPPFAGAVAASERASSTFARIARASSESGGTRGSIFSQNAAALR
jgi:hypothetical protein